MGGTLSHAASSDWERTDVSEVRLVSATSAVGSADTVSLGLHFRMSPEWKIYWRSPGDAGLPPMPEFDGSDNVADARLTWPAPVRFIESEIDIQTNGYLDETVLPLEVRLARPGAPLSLRVALDYQVCAKVCIPVTAALALDLPAGPAEASGFAQLIDRYQSRVPGTPERSGATVESAGLVGAPPAQMLTVAVRSDLPFAAPDLFVEGPERFRFPAPEVSLEEGGARVVFEVPIESRGSVDLTGAEIMVTVVDGARAFSFSVDAAPVAAATTAPAPGVARSEDAGGLLIILGFALLGGLILNLMPCVLPVLSIKLLGVVGHGGGDPRQVRWSFVASALGIIVSFIALAALAVAVKLAGATVGWGMQFQEPIFLAFLVIVLTLFAYNLLGLYEITLPDWLGGMVVGAPSGMAMDSEGRPTGRSSLVGAFATGVVATLLATPCSAPFLGTAIGFALSRGPIEILAVFAALGVGMASPYLVVAAVPSLATRLPKPGRWMLWLRAFMGLALIVTALWLLDIIAGLRGWQPVVAMAVLLVAVGGVIALRRFPSRGAGGDRRAGGAVAGLAAIGLAVIGTLVAPAVLGTAGGRATVLVADGYWRPFDRAAIAGLVAEGKTVLVDVTAEWCVTCKVNKALVLDDADVTARLGGPDIVAMRADWTAPNQEIADYLASFGRYGIPFDVIYGPGAPDGIVLSELLRRNELFAALDRAAVGSRATATID